MKKPSHLNAASLVYDQQGFPSSLLTALKNCDPIYIAGDREAANACLQKGRPSFYLPTDGSRDALAKRLFKNAMPIGIDDGQSSHWIGHVSQVLDGACKEVIRASIPTDWNQTLATTIFRMSQSQFERAVSQAEQWHATNARTTPIAAAVSTAVANCAQEIKRPAQPRIVQIKGLHCIEVWDVIRHFIAVRATGMQVGDTIVSAGEVEVVDLGGGADYWMTPLTEPPHQSHGNERMLPLLVGRYCPRTPGPLIRQGYQDGQRTYEPTPTFHEVVSHARPGTVMVLIKSEMLGGDSSSGAVLAATNGLRDVARNTGMVFIVIDTSAPHRGPGYSSLDAGAPWPVDEFCDEQFSIRPTSIGAELRHDGGCGATRCDTLHFIYNADGRLELVGRSGSSADARQYKLARDAAELLSLIEIAYREKIRFPANFQKHGGAWDAICTLEEVYASPTMHHDELYGRRLLRYLARRGWIVEAPLNASKRGSYTWIPTTEGFRILDELSLDPDFIHDPVFSEFRTDYGARFGDDTASHEDAHDEDENMQGDDALSDDIPF